MKNWKAAILAVAGFFVALAVALYMLVFAPLSYAQNKPAPPVLSSTEKLALISLQAESDKLKADLKDFEDDFDKAHPGWTWTPEAGIQAVPKPPEPKVEKKK